MPEGKPLRLVDVERGQRQAGQLREILCPGDAPGRRARDDDHELIREELAAIHTADDFKLSAVWEVLSGRLLGRHVPLKNLKRGEVEKAAGNTVRQEIPITQSIDDETARKIVNASDVVVLGLGPVAGTVALLEQGEITSVELNRVIERFRQLASVAGS